MRPFEKAFGALVRGADLIQWGNTLAGVRARIGPRLVV